MPHAPDKIIINCNETKAEFDLLMGEYDSLKHLGEETVTEGFEGETDDFRDELEKLCDAKHDAIMKYYNGLRDFRKRYSRWFDERLKKASQQQP